MSRRESVVLLLALLLVIALVNADGNATSNTTTVENTTTLTNTSTSTSTTTSTTTTTTTVVDPMTSQTGSSTTTVVPPPPTTTTTFFNNSNVTTNTTAPSEVNQILLSWWLAPLAMVSVFLLCLFLFAFFRCIKNTCCTDDDGDSTMDMRNAALVTFPDSVDMNSASNFDHSPGSSARRDESARGRAHSTHSVGSEALQYNIYDQSTLDDEES